MTVLVKFDGEGTFEDGDDASKIDGPIASGVPFETTKKRFEELKAAGIPVSKATAADTAQAAQSNEPAAPGEEA